MMPNVGPLEIMLVLIVALVVFGPKKLPDLGHSLGKGIREFKGSVTGESDAPARVEPAPVPVETAPVTTHRVEETHTQA
jgi:sec-independent protein translocase protein TatA